MAQPLDLHVLPGAGVLARAAADHVAACATEAVAERGVFRVAFPGGRTPRAMLELLARDTTLPWSRTTVLLTDERALPPDDPESNGRLVHETLVAALGASGPRFVRMRADAADLGLAAAEYERELQTPLDLVVLGVGEDGHVASLFPGSALVADTIRHVAVVRDSPKPPADRLTLTPRVLQEAHSVLVIASGEGKAGAVARALAESGDPFLVPARLVRGGTWMVDTGAATALTPVA